MALVMRRLLYTCCYIMAVTALIIIWSFVLMIINDNILPPFNRLLSFLMLDSVSVVDLEDRDLVNRLLSTKELFQTSQNITNISWNIMVYSASALFLGYLYLIYKEAQRQLQENRLLRLKNEEISFRNEFIRYISATIGHEFKNNLARIKRRFVLLKGLPPWITENINGNFDKLFADIEIFKKIADTNEVGLVNFEKAKLITLLNEIAYNYKELAIISFSNIKQSIFVFTALPLLKTVFENIIDNAVKYKKDEQLLANINISLSQDIDDKRQYIVLSFKDKGIGMDEQTADNCFYKQSTSKDGWGHGLYYSKYVIGLHAGKIKIGKENTGLGVGTEVLVHLPSIIETENV
jgi:signal transduction histidine kinase